MLKGKHALERAGQILRELAACLENGAAKSLAMSLSDDDASLVISFLDRLGWTFDKEARSPQENLCAWLLHSTGRDASSEELHAIYQEFEAYARGLTIPEKHCLAIATYLQSEPLDGAMTGHWVDNDASPHFTYARQLQFDARLLYEQVDGLAERFCFQIDQPQLQPLVLFTPQDPGLFSPKEWDNWEFESPVTQSGEYSNYQQFVFCRQIADEWLKACCRSTLEAARRRLELPPTWELADLAECDWPSSPVTPTSVSVVREWIELRLMKFCELRDDLQMHGVCLQTGQRDLRNARRALSMLKIELPPRFGHDPESISAIESNFEQLLVLFSQRSDGSTGTPANTNEVPPGRQSASGSASDEYTEPLWKGFLCFVFGDCDDKTLSHRLRENQVIVHPEDVSQISKKKIRLLRDSLVNTSIYGTEKLMAKRDEWIQSKKKRKGLSTNLGGKSEANRNNKSKSE